MSLYVAGGAGAADAADPGLIGRFVEVEITEALTNSLRGRLVAEKVVRRA